MGYYEIINAFEAPRETGLIDGATELLGQGLDILAGGPQKRERAARAERDAAIAMAQAEQARLETARLAAQGATMPAAGGFLSHRTFGVPTVALVAGIGVLAYVLTRRR